MMNVGEICPTDAKLVCSILVDQVLTRGQLGKLSKKSREYNENGTKGGGVSDLNHYLKQLWNSEKGEGAKIKRNLITLWNDK